jgi:regulator of RNase E activity RraA
VDLKKYEAMLEEKKVLKPFPVPDKELCDRYEGVFTSAVNDVLRSEGLLSQVLPHNIMPLRDEMKVCGIAFTIKGSPNLSLEDEMGFRAEMLDAIFPESVVLWDTSGDNESSQWGEIMTLSARKKGCRGAVVDGGVRDTDMILKQNFPVFCRYRTSNAMMGRFRMIAYQAPVSIGNVRIYPGDVVFGDIDGVIIVPRDMAYDVLIKAEEIRDHEVEIKAMVNQGLSPQDVVKKGGYF